ncbi:hypothetical protein HJC23_005040 [Cyclotella cryptica]|uniref:TAZ-type domain-containing protein n=1 Tax=Cyclotella cryptica TaxID=29204 RepID=A0ABD3QDE4_9STRA|eukprot:CCRYP_006260-RB/>CCRYP_006260-RB protein AED:0.04 eAED:0.04 QI:149/1/1/1/0/0/3/935/985
MPNLTDTLKSRPHEDNRTPQGHQRGHSDSPQQKRIPNTNANSDISTKPSDYLDTTDAADAAAALDARIAELTRRRTEIARRAAAAGGVGGGSGPAAAPNAMSAKRGESNAVLAGYVGAAADSFAQAFVDRWASSHDGAGSKGGGGGVGESGMMMMMHGGQVGGMGMNGDLNPTMMMGMQPADAAMMSAATKFQDMKKNDTIGRGTGVYDSMSAVAAAASEVRPNTYGNNPSMADVDYIRQSAGHSNITSQYAAQHMSNNNSMESQAAAAATAQLRNRMNAMNAAGGSGMDMATAAAMGMNYGGMPGQGMMGGMSGSAMSAAGTGYDRRGSQMSINAMDGAQAFQNWQQQQQHQMNSPFFPVQARMGMMGVNASSGGGGMMMQHNPMMQNNPGFPPGMLQGMHPGMMHSLQQQQQLQQHGMMAAKPPNEARSKGQTKRNRVSDSSVHVTPELVEASKGPFKTLDHGIPLALDEDKDWLTPLHCFVRRNCVEAFTASEEDVQAPSKGKRKPIQIGQVGIRCPHCHVKPDPSSTENKEDDSNEQTRERGSVYYPTSLSSIYNATMNLLQRHIHSCSRVPKHVMDKYMELKQDDARSGTSKRYWIESAKSVGFVDTLKGIRLSADAPPSLRPEVFSSQNDINIDDVPKKKKPKVESEGVKDGSTSGGKSEDGKQEGKEGDESKLKGEGKDDEDNSVKGDAKGEPKESKSESDPSSEAPPLVLPSDKDSATAFSFLLLAQMQPCVFTEADRLGKRKGLPTGFAGLACRHCFGGYGSGRFFPSSIKTLSDTSKTLNVLHNHMTRCRKCPQDVIDELAKVRATHDDERAKMKFGSQKAFFAKIWARLHDNRPYDPVAVRNIQQAKTAPHDGAMSNAPARTLPYSSGISNHDMAFMAGQMMGGGPQAGQGMQPGQMFNSQSGQMMGGMGMMAHTDMMMRGYPDQFMMGSFNTMAQFGGGGVGNGSGFSQASGLPKKRGVGNESSEGQKRMCEI